MSKNNPSNMPPANKAVGPSSSESTTLGNAGDVVSVPDVAKTSESGPAVNQTVPAKTEITDPNQDPKHPPPGESASARVLPDVTAPPALPNASPAEHHAAAQEAIVANRGITASPNVPERNPGDGTTHIDAITATIEPGKQYRVTRGNITAAGADGRRSWAQGEILVGLSDDDMNHFLKMGVIAPVDDQQHDDN